MNLALDNIYFIYPIETYTTIHCSLLCKTEQRGQTCFEL